MTREQLMEALTIRGLAHLYEVGRCRLRVSKPVLTAPMVSALESSIW